MRKLLTRTAVVTTAAVAVSGVGIAFAYWTTTGSGSGSASVGAPVAADVITIAQDGSVAGLYPGSAAQSVMVKATNPAQFSQFVGEITATPTYPSDCGAANWTWTPNNSDQLGQLAKTTTSSAYSVGTLALNETNANQDLCKGTTVNFSFTSAGAANPS